MSPQRRLCRRGNGGLDSDEGVGVLGSLTDQKQVAQ